MNILLGVMISLLTGCKTQKLATKSQPDPVKDEPAQIEKSDPVICMYGIPPSLLQDEK